MLAFDRSIIGISCSSCCRLVIPGAPSTSVFVCACVLLLTLPLPAVMVAASFGVGVACGGDEDAIVARNGGILSLSLMRPRGSIHPISPYL